MMTLWQVVATWARVFADWAAPRVDAPSALETTVTRLQQAVEQRLDNPVAPVVVTEISPEAAALQARLEAAIAKLRVVTEILQTPPPAPVVVAPSVEQPEIVATEGELLSAAKSLVWVLAGSPKSSSHRRAVARVLLKKQFAGTPDHRINFAIESAVQAWHVKRQRTTWS